MMNVKIEFTRRQWRIFLGCFLGYTSAYITRLNLPAALNSLMADLSLTSAQGGLLQTVFALVYACGQLVNGAVVDRVSARRHIFIGLSLSAAFNLLFALATHYWMLVVLWALNGAAQSMIWTPVVKLIAVWFKGRSRSQASFGITLTLIVGNVCAWTLSGFLASAINWRPAFTISAAWVLLAAVITRIILPDRAGNAEYAAGDPATREGGTAGSAVPVRTLLRTTGLIPILICCIGNGFVRDGIITWAPTIIARLNGAHFLNPTLTSLMIPLLNLLGVLLARRIYAWFHGHARRCVGCLMLISAILAFLLIPCQGSIYACATLLGLCCSAAYGINPMLTTFIPMEYDRVRCVGATAGMIDSFIYVGSALAGAATGAVSDKAGWSPVFLIWCIAAALSGLAGFMSMRGLRRLEAWNA